MNKVQEVYAANMAASYRHEKALRRQRRQPAILAITLIAGIWLVFGWIAPRIYEPTYITCDELESRTIYLHRRQWFGPTTITPWSAKYDVELRATVWKMQGTDGNWYRAIRSPD